MIFVCPLSRLDATVRASGARRLLSLVSEGTAVDRPAGVAPHDHLTLTFHDIAEPRHGHAPPGDRHIGEALAFAAERPGPIVVHCYAGVSRSTAMAYAIACAREPDRDEHELAATLRRLSPTATPNRLIVRLADSALQRDGRMLSAVERIGRGENCFEGEPFTLAPRP
ncbi:hypothetical protein [Methylopila sp. M107]|uniref:tyrosine phosphatase family protein n=1 Tax=Methylopila sp. M107 TaxID=1101190 RepID=UPI0003775FF1|nr:hypothetical protein [Methylopila sp. M107]